MPGGGFKATARRWAKSTSDMVEVPYAFVKKQIVRMVFDLVELL
jgi:hypothetical protein